MHMRTHDAPHHDLIDHGFRAGRARWEGGPRGAGSGGGPLRGGPGGGSGGLPGEHAGEHLRGMHPGGMHPGGMHPGMHPGAMHRGHRPGGGGRRLRGDVRTAILLLLADGPMHGYQLMEAIAERTGGRWRPSPGAVYPTLNQLEDEGVITVTAGGGRRLATLTQAGREMVERDRATWTDPFAGVAGEDSGPDLRLALAQLHEAVRVVGRTGTPDQRARVAALLADARRTVYLVLAGEATAGPAEEADPADPS
jgi:DNA-binding PadR family transcriptional regulator